MASKERPTQLWLLRHALVERNARAMLYGRLDVALCPDTLRVQAGAYATLAAQLPRPAQWVVTPLSRTQRTAQAIFAAGYPAGSPDVEPGLSEQHLGSWQGLPHAELPQYLQRAAHPFWPLDADERPPGGETMTEVVARVGPTIERLAAAYAGRDVVVVAHGGSIRAAIAHAMGIGATPTLHVAIPNLSLSRLERRPQGWRVLCVASRVDGVAGDTG